MFRSHRDRVLAWLVRACAAVAAAIVLLIFAFLVLESIPALQSVGLPRFFADESWHPAADASRGEFDVVPMLIGTLLATAGAVTLAKPLGVFSALFCHFYAPRRMAHAYRRLIELLAGIPSVVYGFWGLVVLVPLIASWQPPAASLLAGIVILTIMVLPTIAMMADAALANVPREYLRGAAALGLLDPGRTRPTDRTRNDRSDLQRPPRSGDGILRQRTQRLGNARSLSIERKITVSPFRSRAFPPDA